MSELYKIKGFDLEADGIEVHVHMKTTSARINKAHRNLKANFMNAMLLYMPKRTGFLQQATRAANVIMTDTEEMFAAVGSYGRFQYEGKVMVDEETGSPWARKDNRKVVTDRRLTWGNPNAAAHWAEVAWDRHGKRLVQLAQEDLEGK